MSDNPQKLGPIVLAGGVRRINAWFYLLSAFVGVSLTTFISTIQPYVLTVNLNLPPEQYGQVAGDMVFYGELVLIAFSSVIGAMSDRIGRRGVFVGGLVIIAIGYVLYGYVDSFSTLAVARVSMAFGIAAINVMISALQADYPAEKSRGKLVGFAGVAIGLGALMIGVFFMRLPEIYAANGLTQLTAGRYTMFTMAGLALLLAIALQFGLKGGPPPHARPQERLSYRMRIGLSEARDNLRIALAYSCAFVARADLVVVGTFFNLWLTQAGVAQGMQPSEAASAAGIFFGVAMLSALVWAPVMGWLNDRIDRVLAMAVALLLAAVGYLVMGLIPDPLGGWMYPGAVLLGIGQMSAVTASQTLVGQEAPPAHRGSVVGMFSFFGAVGVLFVTTVGGRIYDAISPVAPFVLIGAVNCALFVGALYVSRRTGRTAIPMTAA